VRAVLGVVRTSSQSVTAKTLGVSQGSIRNLYLTALSKLEGGKGLIQDRERVLQLLRLVELSYNCLREICCKQMYKWKINGTKEVGSISGEYLDEAETGFI
jgi:hypothetical protein